MIPMITNSYSQHGLLMDGCGVLCVVLIVVVTGLAMLLQRTAPST